MNNSKTTPLVLISIGIIITAISFLYTNASKKTLDIELFTKNNIMPAAHHVYANPQALQGKYYLFKAKITNASLKKLKNVSIQYQIPGYIEWTELELIGEMFAGQSAVVTCYPKFKKDIAYKTTESIETAHIQITWEGATEDDIIHEFFSFKIGNRNEYYYTNIPDDEISNWADVFDNSELLACFVTPNDPIVQYYTQNIQQKILKGENAAVTKNPQEAVRFLLGIYRATLRSKMVYSSTKTVPWSVTDITGLYQNNRLPREVITGNTGLCLELSLLYASILSVAGLEPVIFLIPGHAFPGFKLDDRYFAIEATGIGGENIGGSMSAEQAFNIGMTELKDAMLQIQQGNAQYRIINIHEQNLRGATPMHLEDDTYLRQKVDKITQSWEENSMIKYLLNLY